MLSFYPSSLSGHLVPFLYPPNSVYHYYHADPALLQFLFSSRLFFCAGKRKRPLDLGKHYEIFWFSKILQTTPHMTRHTDKNTKNKNCPSRYTHGRRNIFYCKNIPKRTTVHPFRNTLSVYTLCIKYSCFPPRKNIGIVSSAASASIHLPPSNTSPEPAQVNVSPAGKYTLRLCAPL